MAILILTSREVPVGKYVAIVILTSREVNEARFPHILAAGRVRSKKKKLKKQNPKKSRRTQNTPRNLQQPGDRDQLEMVRDETRPTR